MSEAYCVKCRSTKEISTPVTVTLKNGRSALQGTCTVCSTKLTRMLPKQEAPDAALPTPTAS